MRWENLLFAHWPMDPAVVRPFLRNAPGLELDLFEDRAWLGIVPFTMSDVALQGLPALPTMRSFPELNVRTYVRHRDHAGVLFLSLDTASRIMVHIGRNVFQVPYHLARMTTSMSPVGIAFQSARRGAASATFSACYQPAGPPMTATRGTFDAWATDRMRVYAPGRPAELHYAEIGHAAWSLQSAKAVIDAAGLARALGLTLPEEPPRLAFSACLDVRGGPPRKA